jgi:competence protein ComEC
VNESSLVVLAEVVSPGGRLRVAALGDLETAGQSALLRDDRARAGLAGVDVVKVAHHGSAKQVSDLYLHLGARVALIGVGTDNDYGHPSPSALDVLRRAGSTVFRTDRDGDVALLPSTGGGPSVGASGGASAVVRVQVRGR